MVVMCILLYFVTTTTKENLASFEEESKNVTTNFSFDVVKGVNSTSVFIDITKCLLHILHIIDSTYFSNVVVTTLQISVGVHRLTSERNQLTIQRGLPLL